MTTQTKRAAPARQARLSQQLIGIVALAIVVAVGIFAFMALTGDGKPTVTFDGENAVYDGPATLEAGEHTFVFDASAFETDVAVFFQIGLITDSTITDAEIDAYDNLWHDKPPFIGRYKVFWIQADAEDRVIEETFSLDSDTRHAIHAGERRHDNPDHFAGTFEVE